MLCVLIRITSSRLFFVLTLQRRQPFRFWSYVASAGVKGCVSALKRLPILYYCTYSRLSLSRSPRNSLEYFEISVPRHTWFAELRKTINRTTTFNKWVCNLTPEVKRNIEYFVAKFSTIFWYLLLDFHVRTGTRFSLRDKRLFEVSEFEVTKVDYIIFLLSLGSSNLFWLLNKTLDFCSFVCSYTLIIYNYILYKLYYCESCKFT